MTRPELEPFFADLERALRVKRVRRNINIHNLRSVRGAACRMCRTGHGRRSAHHLVPVRNGRDDAIDNLVCLCRDCHSLVDSHDPDVRLAARTELRARLLPSEVAYMERRMGSGYPDREYPLSGRAAP